MIHQDDALRRGSFQRDTVLVIGGTSFSHQAFLERNLVMVNTTLEKARSSFRFARAIILAGEPNDLDFIANCLKQLYEEALDHGILVRIVVRSTEEFDLAFQRFRQINVKIESFYLENDLVRLAESIARYSPGPPDSDVILEGECQMLNEEQLLLLRRSFYDCANIYVERIAGGKDSSHLLKVHAWQRNSMVKSSLLPFFVKISTPQKTKDELANYRVYTDLYISFQYRPNCRIERCVLTSHYGSLVGNFVEDALPLTQSLANTHYTGIIYSLFEKTLKGFRRRPFSPDNRLRSGNLRDFVKERIWSEKLVERVDVVDRAKQLGLTTSVPDLCGSLLECTAESCFTSPVHGDLHSGNIMVRGNDAIVIDFSAIKPAGPMTADPATLEVSLAFNLPEPANSSFNTQDKCDFFFNEWKAFIDEVYAPERMLTPLAHTDRMADQFDWLRRSLRELRHIMVGCDCCQDEVEAITACYLIRIARLAGAVDANSYRDRLQFDMHAYALVAAERIIKFLLSRK
ncbi:MAG TPA: phosphotransferase [Cyclobacteriaceae bacterium]|nr:phosphotransferase [Cyclobacteriaceae bacterium]HMV09291.1 phosphotransferase [Cyclobacteriaceae bacterium]HMX01909.1 phosphotransferase [Cyclobacteriaceae bacterium]HMX50832.1 phosphotransferase [Cyclobacteriaceae bacterium]HMY94732.1 phosphotransferase [Cyclobacteriaceae bacterium]